MWKSGRKGWFRVDTQQRCVVKEQNVPLTLTELDLEGLHGGIEVIGQGCLGGSVT